MARVFCTLKEAAAWLNTTEPQLKAMLAEGVLPEFRDGANRLLRVSDVRDLAVARAAEGPQPCRQEVPQPVGVFASHEPKACEPDIKLPRSGTAVLSAPAYESSPLSLEEEEYEPPFVPTTEPSLPPEAHADPDSWPCYNAEIETPRAYDDPETPANRRPAAHAWPRLRTEKTIVRKGLWTGVMEDRPSAIVTLLAITATVASALVAGGYILARFLR